LEDILAWLRQHELVRLIEIERTVVAGDVRSFSVETNAEPTRRSRQLHFIPTEYEDAVFVTVGAATLAKRLLARMLEPLVLTAVRFHLRWRRLIRIARHGRNR
jgi:hypothetical protein